MVHPCGDVFFDRAGDEIDGLESKIFSLELEHQALRRGLEQALKELEADELGDTEAASTIRGALEPAAGID